MTTRPIRVHIDELILHGFTPGDRYRIAESLERELKRLLDEQRPPPFLGENHALTHLDAGSFNVAPNARPETVGTQVAHAIYKRLKQSPSSVEGMQSSKGNP